MSVETLLDGGQVLFRNLTRYLEPRWANVVPANLAPDLAAEVGVLVDAAQRAVGVDRGITHAEVFLTERGPVFGEIAARPPGGLLMELIGRAWDFDPWRAWVQIELGEAPAALPQVAARHAGVWFLHPGAGTVTGVEGVEAARAMPGVARVRCAAEVGQVITERVGSGEAVGEVVVTADGHDECAARLRAAKDAISILVG